MSTRGLVHGLARAWRPAGSDVRGPTAAGAPGGRQAWACTGQGTRGRSHVRMGAHGTGWARVHMCRAGWARVDACRAGWMRAGSMASCELEIAGGGPLLPLPPRQSPVPLSPLLSAATVNTFCRGGSALS